MKTEQEKELRESGFLTPPGHERFLAKELMRETGGIRRCAVAYIGAGGGGPYGNHTHEENHLFLVAEGEVRIVAGERTVVLKKDESFLVEGCVPHSIWNNSEETAKVFKISLNPEKS